ncbi:MAG: hypothetical protein ACKOC5_09325 [Chloroflexota bacterium]
MSQSTQNRPRIQRLRVGLSLGLVLFGSLLYALGVRPALFGMDRSLVVGFVQIAVFLIGLALVCLGGYLAMNILWAGEEKTIVADIGFRLVSTGYVIAAASGMADTLGFGSQPFPSLLYFGQWQAIGVIAGDVVIAIGFLMLAPRRRARLQE